MASLSRALLPALLVLAAVAVVPTASATAEIACPTLPLWDAVMCWEGVAVRAAQTYGEYVRCDVVGGPACAMGVCVAYFGICL